LWNAYCAYGATAAVGADAAPLEGVEDGGVLGIGLSKEEQEKAAKVESFCAHSLEMIYSARSE